MSLHASPLITINKKAVQKFGGLFGIRDQGFLNNLGIYVADAGNRYEWDKIECFCLAAYQIVKIHPFIDGNKRTALLALLNCLRKENLFFTGSPKDLADKIIEMAKSPANEKENAVLEFSYFLKAHLQTKRV